MKMLLALALLTGFTCDSWALTTYVTAWGQDFGSCSYSQSFTCMSNIKRRAESEATRQAEWNCQAKGGSSNTYSASCSTSCVPSFLSPGDQNTPVRCSSTCTILCELPN